MQMLESAQYYNYYKCVFIMTKILNYLHLNLKVKHYTLHGRNKIAHCISWSYLILIIGNKSYLVRLCIYSLVGIL